MDSDIFLHNIEVLQGLDKAKYPALYSLLRRTSAGKCAIAIMKVMMEYKKPWYVTRLSGDSMFVMSESYLVKWSIKHPGEGATSTQTWQTAITNLILVGLISRLIPDRNTNTLLLRKIYDKAITEGRRPENILWVREYTEETLTNAESICQTRKAAGVPWGKTTKTSVILAHGYDVANEHYHDARDIPARFLWIQDRLRECIYREISENGFVKKEDVVKSVARELADGYDKVPKRESKKDKRKRFSADIDEVENNVWSKTHKGILSGLGVDYRRPSVEEKEKYGLTNDRWIIVKKR